MYTFHGGTSWETMEGAVAAEETTSRKGPASYLRSRLLTVRPLINTLFFFIYGPAIFTKAAASILTASLLLTEHHCMQQ
jgi:hypothetical protein